MRRFPSFVARCFLPNAMPCLAQACAPSSSRLSLSTTVVLCCAGTSHEDSRGDCYSMVVSHYWHDGDCAWMSQC
jgi:hypothetical protein